ncbi:uncharacterized protein LOC121765658 [Salvia splendens]|uniref:uncharacterized protein LOC121765658 n=1 Tax=Salvia splendens TaxID=180675 RepID=UPI001C25F3AB|nr:uncharacterized protein LOC121765658 [Salvia splendens]XP_042017792.1 uncharacterized protein LOC121765658 [Salvia splendens]
MDDDCEEDENPLISIHAISGSSSCSFKTIRITGRVGNRPLHILVDSGSTYNFLDLRLAKRLGLQLTPIRPVSVDVAVGNRLDALLCAKICSLRGTTFHTEVLLLPSGNCDMVLGVQWLETLGVIHWDFKHLTMDFTLDGKRYVLRGGQSDPPVMAISDREMNKLLAHSDGIQLCCVKVNSNRCSELLSLDSSAQEEQRIPSFIHSFLDSQGEVFKEATALPPPHSKDHRIVLNPGASPVNSRTYRHTALQKNIIEK